MKSFFTIICILILFLVSTFTDSFAQTSWTRDSQPVLEPGPTGAWDSYQVYGPTVIKIGDKYHMWYSGLKEEAKSYIGHATSQDGYIWTKDTLNPVLKTGPTDSWDEYGVDWPSVILVDGIIHMWYAGNSSSVNVDGWRIGHATSMDGKVWTKDALNPVIDVGPEGSWDSAWIYPGGVIRVDTTYHMWYHAWDGESMDHVRIGHATSPDGQTWTKDQANPVLSAGAAENWDYPGVRAPYVLKTGASYYMYYSGGRFGNEQIGYANSNDGSNWTKDTLNPVLDYGSPGSWDDLLVGFCSVILDTVSSLYKMWYTGAGTLTINTTKIGYAEATPTAIYDKISSAFPGKFVLMQNFPNPFNPSTIINYELPITNVVDLSIYNLLGQKVATLVSENKNTGQHQVEWDASGFASGIYYYRIDAGEFQDVKKMILLR
jgi:predicted GH43/DUF377 family glycosyl hydrolase